uniref:(California timema) hypothetical protein n=1 Tax=Timema californicum TaxID=61474 RepID=A0A7R9J4T3_TIMCA|nr:unnamed protein product [Timema californicum]
MVAKLQERSPLKQKAVRGLSSLDPCVIQHSPQLGQKRLSFLLEELNHANIINDVLAENAKKEYLHFCDLKKPQLQEIFHPCDQSFCPDHRPPPVLKPKGIQRKEKGGRNTTKCVMCLEEVVMIRNKDVIQAPCCGHCSWFHRLCVQVDYYSIFLENRLS